MKSKRRLYKILMITLASVLALGAIIFLFSELAGLPNCEIHSRTEAITKFSAYFDGINAILEPYGLRTGLPDAPDDFGLIEGEDDECELFAYVYLENGETLYISLTWERGYSEDFYLSLDGVFCDDATQCYLTIEQYPYLYKIAEYLCAGRFSASQYQTYLSAAKQRVEKEIEEEGADCGVYDSKYLESAFFKLGTFEYSVAWDTQKQLFYPQMVIYMSLYE